MLELASIIILGIAAQWIAWRLKVPAILPLILTGLLFGPISTLWTADGFKIIDPIYVVGTENAADHGLFPGRSLFYFVSLSIGLILFEGGLTLRRSEIRGVGGAIGKLITLGSLITFIGAGIAAYFLMGLSLSISFLFAALIIVTGPTVIAPILQNVPLSRNVSTVLKWEGILIDPLGALVAVLVYNFIRSGEGAAYTWEAFTTFVTIICIGLAIGAGGAYLLSLLIRKKLLPHYLLNVFTLALVLFVFVLSDQLEHESGLLSVVIMGMVLGEMNLPELKDVLDFKESLSVLLISILFILLSANMHLDDLELLLDWRCLVLFAVVVLILRPLAVFASTTNSELNYNEKLYISWVGPRGIVAAGIASLFGLTLTAENVPGAEYITPLVFMIVLGTVLLNATTARPIAYLLKVTLSTSDGILIVGANPVARLIAKYLHDNGRHVVVVDTNPTSLRQAEAQGLRTIQSNVYTDDLSGDIDLLDVGYLLAMTSNNDVNLKAIERYKDMFGEQGTYRFLSPEELHLKESDRPREGILAPTDDYINFSEVARDYPAMHEIPVNDVAAILDLRDQLRKTPSSIPLFLRHPDGHLEFLIGDLIPPELEDGWSLVYMGKEVKLELPGRVEAEDIIHERLEPPSES